MSQAQFAHPQMETIKLLCGGVEGIALMLERLGLEGFAIWKCDKCPDWHCGITSRDSMAFSGMFASSGDPYYAACDTITQLVNEVVALNALLNSGVIVVGGEDE